MAGSHADLKDLLSPEVRSRLVDRLERFLDLGRWGFRLTYVEPIHGPVIYDSPKCRIECRLSIEREGDEIAIDYGRRHAPNDGYIIEWKGERCYAWHNLWRLRVTEFLEGLSPEEVVERDRMKLDTPARIAFVQTERGRSLHGADRQVARQAFNWQRYEDRLFSLFDVREAQRWEELRRFVKRYYELRPELSISPLFGIPRWHIC